MRDDSGKTKKIILIGPVWPYKGGIAHYTGMLYRTFQKKYDAEMISYKMQYPRFLYRSSQKDYSNKNFQIPETEFLLNTANPLNIWKVGREIRRKKPLAVIIQWWHPYFAPCYRLLEIALGKKIKKIFICHNVFPHERFPFDRLLAKTVLKHGDGFIVHSRNDGKALRQIVKKPRIEWNPHPTYEMFRFRGLSRDMARKELGIDRIDDHSRVMLFFGFVREYKGLKYLIQAMPEICSRMEHMELVIAGSFGKDRAKYEEQIENSGVREYIHVVDNYIPDTEMEKYYAACDLVVCPYLSATQSGIVQTAFGFERAVIVTKTGGLPEVVDHGKTGYIVPPGNSDKLAEAVIEFFSENKREEFEKNIKNDAERFSWNRILEKIERLL